VFVRAKRVAKFCNFIAVSVRCRQFHLASTSCIGESRQAGRDLHLHVDAAGLDPFKGYRGNALDHAAPLPQSKVAEGAKAGKNIKGTNYAASAISFLAACVSNPDRV
jgi:hypothetical protein